MAGRAVVLIDVLCFPAASLVHPVAGLRLAVDVHDIDIEVVADAEVPVGDPVSKVFLVESDDDVEAVQPDCAAGRVVIKGDDDAPDHPRTGLCDFGPLCLTPRLRAHDRVADYEYDVDGAIFHLAGFRHGVESNPLVAEIDIVITLIRPFVQVVDVDKQVVPAGVVLDKPEALVRDPVSDGASEAAWIVLAGKYFVLGRRLRSCLLYTSPSPRD